MRPAAAFLATTLILQGIPRFAPVQPDLFEAGGSLTNAWADTDGDGDLDLFVGFNGEANRLYRNDSGRFSDVASIVGLADARPTRAAAWGDYDGDGDPDLLLGFTPAGGHVLRLYRNDAGSFTDVTTTAELIVDSAAVRQPVWVDFDGDDDLDLFVAFRDRANALFENVDGVFTDIAGLIGLADTRRTVGAVWFDFDQDGDLDLYAGNMDGDANALFRNDDGRFADEAESLGVQWGGRAPGEASNGTVRPCAADVDNDGRFDLFMANYGPNGLFRNRAAGFEDVSLRAGVAADSRYDSCAFGDWDNDGLVDLFVNGTVTGGVAYGDVLFRNRGGVFANMTPEVLRTLDGDHGVQWADYDRDGDVDLAMTAVAANGHHSLLRNGLSPDGSARGLNIVARDASGRTIAPGSEIRVYSSGNGSLIGARLVDSGSGYNSQNSMPVHVGLGDATLIDIEITRVHGGTRATARIDRVDTEPIPNRTLELELSRDGTLSIVG